MAVNNEPTSINSYKRRWNFNIGIILFGVIFIYLAVTVITYLTARQVAVYEVREGSILKDTAYTGFIVRSETVVYAEQDGYVNFYVSDNEKVAVGAKVYMLSRDEVVYPEAEDSEAALSGDDQNIILSKTQAFTENFNPSHFQNVYTLKNDLEAVLDTNESQNRVARLNTIAENSEQQGLGIYTTAQDGIVTYATDGYEEITAEAVGAGEITGVDYEHNQTYNNQKVKSGAPLYKLITSEEWTIVIKLSENSAEELAEKTSVRIKIPKDNQTMVAAFRMEDKGKEGIFGYLTLEKAMIRYISERYLDVELILQDQSGLKIPKSAMVEKDFYVIPETYLTQGGNSKETGVMVMTEDIGSGTVPAFQAAAVYYRDEEEGLAYLDMEAFEAGTTLLKPDSAETCRLAETRSLKGVYNINKGYALFKQIQILSESDEYYIVEDGNKYSLSNYDHIVLDGNGIREYDVVF